MFRTCQRLRQVSLIFLKQGKCQTSALLKPGPLQLRSFHVTPFSLRFKRFDDDDYDYTPSDERTPQIEHETQSFSKNVFEPRDEYNCKTEEEIEKFRQESKITIVNSTNPVPNPVFNFADCQFPPRVTEILEKAGFDKPMPIQAQGWPIALSGSDMIGIGETGSGKTLGFLLPAFKHIVQNKDLSGRGPQVLILAPTRELAQQTETVAKRFGRAAGFQAVSLVGGANRFRQIEALRNNKPQIVVGTPGRMNDLIDDGHLELNRCTYLVLDEADRMLDMGFEPQIRKIFRNIRPDRQIMMWSATWPKEVEEMSEDFFKDSKDFVHLNIGSVDLKANQNITQEFVVLRSSDDKKDELLKAVRSLEDDEKILIFAATKRSVDYIERLLERFGHRAAGMHGDKSQMQRDQALRKFREGRTSILVATDVAARGLDVDDIQLVINYDMTLNIEDYIHRIGRTGRRGKSGVAKTFLVDVEVTRSIKKELIKVIKDAGQEVPEDVEYLEASGAGGKGSNRFAQDRGPDRGFNRYGDRSFSNNRYNRNFRSDRDEFQRRSTGYDNYDRRSSGIDDLANYDNRRNSYGGRRNAYDDDNDNYDRRPSGSRRNAYDDDNDDYDYRPSGGRRNFDNNRFDDKRGHIRRSIFDDDNFDK